MLAAAVAAHPAAVAIELMNEPPTLDNPGRAQSRYRFVLLPRIRLIPVSLAYSVPLFLKR
jgi:hypothetical protein